MKKLSMIYVMMLAAFVLFNGCESSNIDPHGDMVPDIMLTNNPECKPNSYQNTKGDIPLEDVKTILTWEYSNNTLTLKHENVGFNCCPERIEVGFKIEDRVITITEREKSSLCDCLCLYDLDLVINDLPAGEYQFKVDEEYLNDGDMEFDFTLDLDTEPSGKRELPRYGYPWF